MGQGSDLICGDIRTVFCSEKVLKQNLEREWEVARSIQSGDIEDLVLFPRDFKYFSCAEGILTHARILIDEARYTLDMLGHREEVKRSDVVHAIPGIN